MDSFLDDCGLLFMHISFEPAEPNEPTESNKPNELNIKDTFIYKMVEQGEFKYIQQIKTFKNIYELDIKMYVYNYILPELKNSKLFYN